MIIKKATMDDVEGIYNVYLLSSKAHPESLTQYEDELTIDYIEKEVKNSLERGLILVAVDEENKIVGSFKGYTSKYRKLAHIMTNSTFTVSPTPEGKKGFVILFKAFIEELKNNYKHIYKLEGIPHESNRKLVDYYLRRDFTIDYELENKIYNSTTNNFEKELIINWINPNFSMEELKKYHEYLKKISK